MAFYHHLTVLLTILSLSLAGLPAPIALANEGGQQDAMSIFRQDMDQWKSQMSILGDGTFKATVNKFFGENCNSGSCSTCLVVSTANHSDPIKSHTWIGAFSPQGPQTMLSDVSVTLKGNYRSMYQKVSAPCKPGNSNLTCNGAQCCLNEGTNVYNKLKQRGQETCFGTEMWQDVSSLIGKGTIGEGSKINWINYGIDLGENDLMMHEGVACHKVNGRDYPCDQGSAGCVVIYAPAMKAFCEKVYGEQSVKMPMFFALDKEGTASDYDQKAAKNYAELKKKGSFCSQMPTVAQLGNITTDGASATAPQVAGAENTDPNLTGSDAFKECNQASRETLPKRVEAVQAEGQNPAGFMAEKTQQNADATPPGGTAAIQVAAAAQESMNKNCHLTYATEARTTGSTDTSANATKSNSPSGGGNMLGPMIGIAAVGGIAAYAIIESKKSEEEGEEEAAAAREAEVAECRKIVNDSTSFGSQRERCRTLIAEYEEEEAKKNAYQTAFTEQVSALPDDEMMSSDSELTVTNENDSDNTREYTHSLMAHYDESRRLEHEFGQKEKEQTKIDLTAQAQSYSESTDKQAEALSYQDAGRGRMVETLDGYQNIYSNRAALLQRDLALVPTSESLTANCIQNTARSGYDKTPIYDYLISPVKSMIRNPELKFDNQADCQGYVARNDQYLLTNKQIYGQADKAIQDTVNVVVGIQDIKDTLASQRLKGAELAAYFKNHPVLLELGEKQIELEACAEIGCWNHPKTNTKVLSDLYGPSKDPGVNILYQNLREARSIGRAPSGHDIFNDPAFSKYLNQAGFNHLGKTASIASINQKSLNKKEVLKNSQNNHGGVGLVKGEKKGLFQGNGLGSENSHYAGGRFQGATGDYTRGEDGVLRSKSGKAVMGNEAPAHANLFKVISHRYRQKFFADAP